MSPERIKTLLFDIGSKLGRTATYHEFERLSAQYRALKNKWNEATNNAVLSYELFSNKSLDNSSDTIYN